MIFVKTYSGSRLNCSILSYSRFQGFLITLDKQIIFEGYLKQVNFSLKLIPIIKSAYGRWGDWETGNIKGILQHFNDFVGWRLILKWIDFWDFKIKPLQLFKKPWVIVPKPQCLLWISNPYNRSPRGEARMSPIRQYPSMISTHPTSSPSTKILPNNK